MALELKNNCYCAFIINNNNNDFISYIQSKSEFKIIKIINISNEKNKSIQYEKNKNIKFEEKDIVDCVVIFVVVKK